MKGVLFRTALNAWTKDHFSSLVVYDIWTLFGWWRDKRFTQSHHAQPVRLRRLQQARRDPVWYLWKLCSRWASRCSRASTFRSSRLRTAVSSRLAGLMRCAVSRHT